MNKNFIFFFVATIILILSIASLYIAPIINEKLGTGENPWKNLNCLIQSDNIDELKEDISSITDDQEKEHEEKYLKYLKRERDLCYRKKAMHGLEYSAFTLDVIIGFICSLLGFIHYLDEGKSFISKTGLIGLILGAIGFVITLVYLIYNILVYTSHSDVPKVDEKMAYANWDNSKNVYFCQFFKEDNYESIYAKYSELGQKQYNYNKELYQSHMYEDTEIGGCVYDRIDKCFRKDNFTGIEKYINNNGKDCNKIYMRPTWSNEYIDLNNRWLTTIILSAITILCNACLSFLGFLLFKNKEESGEVKVV